MMLVAFRDALSCNPLMEVEVVVAVPEGVCGKSAAVVSAATTTTKTEAKKVVILLIADLWTIILLKVGAR
jgi:uncharacterized membrane protein YadS